MNILSQIKNVPNRKVVDIENLRNSTVPAVMYGAGSYAVDVTKFLAKHGVKIKSYYIDGQYITSETPQVNGHNVKDISQLANEYERFNLVIGFSDYRKARKVLAAEGIIDNVYFIDAPNHLDFFDYAYIESHQESFQNTYDLLADDKSREIFIAFLNAKISGDPDSLYDFAEFNQYFTEPIELGKDEVFVDCGAYDGDTANRFIENASSAYKHIVALEPDLENYQKLVKNVEGKKNISTYNVGCWSSKGTVSFSSDGNMATIVESGGEGPSVNVDTIDNLVGDLPVTYIKMDIEGAEFEALRGAENTIKKFTPKLAVCAYHKPDDLFVLPTFINQLSKSYKFYLRHHQHMSWEMVMYAVPQPAGVEING